LETRLFLARCIESSSCLGASDLVNNLVDAINAFIAKGPRMRSLLVFALSLVLPLSAQAATPSFSHTALDQTLQNYVDSTGMVDYWGLKQDRALLDAYIDSIGKISPDTAPTRFPTPQDELAYWINAYNAFVLRGVLDNYPVKSVKDIALLNGFFNRTDFIAGGKELTLDALENKIIRPRYRDPRIHFVVNCGAWSCPALENRAFDGPTLDQRLDSAARRSLNDPKYLRYDKKKNTLYISKILDWYGQDFIDWYPASSPVAPRLLDYIELYVAETVGQAFKDKNPKIDFDSYDWRLNDQALTRP
jgi:hypothetical protein